MEFFYILTSQLKPFIAFNEIIMLIKRWQEYHALHEKDYKLK